MRGRAAARRHPQTRGPHPGQPQPAGALMVDRLVVIGMCAHSWREHTTVQARCVAVLLAHARSGPLGAMTSDFRSLEAGVLVAAHAAASELHALLGGKWRVVVRWQHPHFPNLNLCGAPRHVPDAEQSWGLRACAGVKRTPCYSHGTSRTSSWLGMRAVRWAACAGAAWGRGVDGTARRPRKTNSRSALAARRVRLTTRGRQGCVHT